MNKETKDNTLNTIRLFQDKKIENEVKILKEEDLYFSLKKTIYDFFNYRFSLINEEDKFKEIVKEALIKKIEAGELSISQLMALYTDINRTNSFATATLLDIFKPSKEGAMSPIVSPNNSSDRSNDDNEKIKDIDKDGLELLNKLTQIVNMINSKENKTDDKPIE
jgi:hypothetical protein